MKVRDGKRLKLEMVDIYGSGTYNYTIYFAYKSNHVTVISHLTQYFKIFYVRDYNDYLLSQISIDYSMNNF